MYEDDLMASDPVKPSLEQEEWDPDQQQEHGKEDGVTHMSDGHKWTAKSSLLHDAVDGMQQLVHGTGEAGAKDMPTALRKAGVKSRGLDATAGEKYLNEERRMITPEGDKVQGFPSAVVPTLEEKIIAENRPQPERGQDEPINEQLSRAKENDSAQQDQPQELRDVRGEAYGAPAEAQRDARHDEEPPTARVGKHDVADDDEEKAPGARSTLREDATATLN
ncbi:hypothetical protein CERSUDRAFT_100157 [Gelatoporia subvermispora B]|uniref:Uncharacterized protein n=1 Tax=Ceriporiopsis subvermispora (strain B) TaxID=914234 RepID=M2QHW9_CERS8|nr:hypothetical protein CERSUDRAFT_100157 [Gelatoporia subvermispora B]